MRTTVATFVPARDVVAGADEALGDEAVERRRTAVSATDLRASETRARAASSERYDCSAAFCADLILLARRLDLGPALIELALRDDLLIEQRPHAVELRFGEIERRLGVHHVRHALGSNGCPAASPSRASICAALASASCSCADVSDGEMRTSSAPWRDAGAALDRRLDDAARRFRR